MINWFVKIYKIIKKISDILISLGEFIWIVPGLLWIWNYIKKPTIQYGLFDHPHSNEAHYFIIVRHSFYSFLKIFMSMDFTQIITCNIVSDGLSLKHYKIQVRRAWYERIGSEHLSEIIIEPKITNEDHKITFDFELCANRLYRIIIKSDGGQIGSLCGDYKLNIESKDTIVKRNDYYLPK